LLLGPPRLARLTAYPLREYLDPLSEVLLPFITLYYAVFNGRFPRQRRGFIK